MPMGTPPQLEQMVLDTGSQLSWVQCRRKDSGAPSFNPNASSSFSNVACNDTVCVTHPTQRADFTLPRNCSHDLCRYTVSFGDGTLAEGNLVWEQFKFSDSQIAPRLVIGCSPKKDIMSGADGMLAMNRGNLSFISQLKEHKFSYCVPLRHDNIHNISDSDSNSNSNGSDGTFYYANLSNTSQQSQSMADFDSLQYYVRLVNIQINGEILNIDKSEVNSNASCQMMIDSGTRYTYLVDAAYNSVREKVANLTGEYIKDMNVDAEFDMCFQHGSNLSDIEEKIGDVVFEFENGVKISIPKERSLDIMSDCGVCVAIGRSDRLGFPTNIFGFFYQQDLCVEFDIQKNQVGFGKADGSKLPLT
ncbi:aspartic proteinase pcs1 [Phtheirospermum japonicum]|uniref:Aspartic proteinase pcs1 n=1 Tax=Phtheirospermum japonicum TaxID=374723 RepID=A0A830CGY9_9LAMI|nr:aspartic proteinase pcs1 [Phtheirospermum japonicum]